MKKLILISILFIVGSLFGEDKLIKKNGTIVWGKVTSIADDYLYFKTEEGKSEIIHRLHIAQAQEDAGTWIYCSTYLYNHDTSEKTYLYQNRKISKIE